MIVFKILYMYNAMNKFLFQLTQNAAKFWMTIYYIKNITGKILINCSTAAFIPER